MAKVEKANEEIIEIVNNIIVETFGKGFITTKIVSSSDQKTLIKIKKANPIIEYFVNAENCIIITINEILFYQLSDEQRKLIILNELEGVYYDTEKDKLIVQQPPLNISIGCYNKFGNNLIEAQKTMIEIQKLMNSKDQQ